MTSGPKLAHGSNGQHVNGKVLTITGPDRDFTFKTARESYCSFSVAPPAGICNAISKRRRILMWINTMNLSTCEHIVPTGEMRVKVKTIPTR